MRPKARRSAHQRPGQRSDTTAHEECTDWASPAPGGGPRPNEGRAAAARSEQRRCAPQCGPRSFSTDRLARLLSYPMDRATEGVPEGFDDLSLEEQLQLLEALWQRIVPRVEAAPVPAAHRQVITARLRDVARSPQAEAPASDVLERLRRELSSE